MSISAERAQRDRMWVELIARGGPVDVDRRVLRELGIYGGAQGVWVDAARTRGLVRPGVGTTVAVLHTGKTYADDLSSDGVIYHYPTTQRAGARDESEVEATKAAAEAVLPIFVVTPGKGSSRTVHRGWVDGWDDEARLFLISFSAEPDPVTPQTAVSDSDPFSATVPRVRLRREAAARAGQQRFKFLVLRRYGARCALCGLDIVELLDAAHLHPAAADGSNDPRNGLPLCPLHHRALDLGLVAIEPESFELCAKPGGPALVRLGVTVEDLSHLPALPHPDALLHQWRRFAPMTEGSVK